MSDKTRAELSPALCKVAECFCIYDLTDGFCHPRNKENCECWKKAKAMMESTEMSANACCFVLKYKSRIEKEANQ